jgi:hypothetical protein
MEVDGGEDMPNPNGLSQISGSQEWSIFKVPPGQVIPFNQDSEMRDDTNDGESGDGLGPDAAKPGSESVGGPDAVHDGLSDDSNATGGPRTSARERKETPRFDPNNRATY